MRKIERFRERLYTDIKNMNSEAMKDMVTLKPKKLPIYPMTKNLGKTQYRDYFQSYKKHPLGRSKTVMGDVDKEKFKKLTKDEKIDAVMYNPNIAKTLMERRIDNTNNYIFEGIPTSEATIVDHFKNGKKPLY